MATIRWGIIGCGDVCEVKSGPALQRAENSTLAAVMRRNAAKAADFAHRHGVPAWFDDAGALLAHPRVDAVYIATPPNTHRAYTEQAAAAGKHVLVEKPMAMSVAECEAMIAACRRAGVTLTVAYYRRALPRFEHLRRLVQGGALGAVRMVLVRHFWPASQAPGAAWRQDPAVNGGGIFVDTQAHVLDWLDHVFGPALAVNGLRLNQAGLYLAEDAVSATVAYPGKVVANFACDYVADRFEEIVTVIGDTGRASMRFFGPSPITLRTADGETTVDMTDPPHVHQPLVQQVVDHLNGGQPPASGADNGLRVARIFEQLHPPK